MVKKKMSTSLGFPESVLIQSEPPATVGPTEVWLAVPAMYEVPFNYGLPPQTLANYGKEIWMRLLPQHVSNIDIQSGNADIIFTPNSGIKEKFDAQNPDLTPVGFQGYRSVTVANGISSLQLVTPESVIYSLNVNTATQEQLANIPVVTTERTAAVRSTTAVTPGSTIVRSSTAVTPDSTVVRSTTAATDGFNIPFFGTIGQSSITSGQLLTAAQQQLFRAPSTIANVIQGQLGSPIQNKNPGWRIFW